MCNSKVRDKLSLCPELSACIDLNLFVIIIIYFEQFV